MATTSVPTSSALPEPEHDRALLSSYLPPHSNASPISEEDLKHIWMYFGGASLLVLCWQLFIIIYPLSRGWEVCYEVAGNRWAWYSKTFYTTIPIRQTCYCIFAMATFLPVLWFMVKRLRRWRKSSTLVQRLVALSICLTWAVQLAYATAETASWCQPGSAWLGRWVYSLLYLVGNILYFWQQWLFLGSVGNRVELITKAFDNKLGSSLVSIHAVRFVVLLTSLICLVFTVIGKLILAIGHKDQLSSLFAVQIYFIAWGLKDASDAASFLFVAFRTFTALNRVRQALRPTPRDRANQSPMGHLAPKDMEDNWAHSQLCRVQWATALPCTLDAVGFAVLVVIDFFIAFAPGGFDAKRWKWLRVAHSALDPVVRSIPMLFESFCLFYAVGIFEEHALDYDKHNVGTPSPMLQSVSEPSRSKRWKQKVEELAQRGMSVSALLDFYMKLGPEGEIMQHFNPEQSTTNDVVRQAIIPLSRIVDDDGLAYASIVDAAGVGARSGACTTPCRMVTHGWSRLFVGLIATVVADALGEDESGAIKKKLIQGHIYGPNGLRECLEEKGTIHQSYWICAFCINQHASICDGFGEPPDVSTCEDTDVVKKQTAWEENRRDTVTKDVFKCCPCQRKKTRSFLPPEDKDESELNKFDDVMRALHTKNQGSLRQIIYVDPDFEVFKRAWCVAEAVEASIRRMQQKAILESHRSWDIKLGDFALHEKLHRLSVNNCDASREEDKNMILEKAKNMSPTGDIREFDLRLRWLIFSGKGLRCERFEGFDALTHAALIARRTETLRSHE